MPTKISKTYTPSSKEKYMCAKHKAYFRKALAEWKNELIEQNNRIIFGNDDDNAASADVVDQATSFANKSVEMRTVNRHKKLMKKIDSALQKIEDGTYGYCEETGEEIGLCLEPMTLLMLQDIDYQPVLWKKFYQNILMLQNVQ